MFDARTNLSIQVADEVKKYYPKKVYASVIPRNVLPFGGARATVSPSRCMTRTRKVRKAIQNLRTKLLKETKE